MPQIKRTFCSPSAWCHHLSQGLQHLPGAWGCVTKEQRNGGTKPQTPACFYASEINCLINKINKCSSSDLPHRLRSLHQCKMLPKVLVLSPPSYSSPSAHHDFGSALAVFGWESCLVDGLIPGLHKGRWKSPSENPASRLHLTHLFLL